MNEQKLEVIKTKAKRNPAKAKKNEVMVIDHLQPVVAKYEGVMLTKAQKYSLDYAAPMSEFNELSKVISEVKDRDNPTKEECKLLYRSRQAMVKIRTRIGEIKDSQKETMKLEDKCIMSLHNTGIDLIKLTEAEFLSIEKIEERRESDRLDALEKSRSERLEAFGEVNKHMPIRDMDDESFEEYFNDQKTLFEIKETKRKAEAETERLRLEKEEADRKALIATQEENNKKLKQQSKYLKELIGMGFTFDGERIFSVDKQRFMYSDLLTISESDYQKGISVGVKMIEAQALVISKNQAIADAEANKLAVQHQELMTEQYQNRCDIARLHLTVNGFVSDIDTKTMVNTRYGIVYDWDDYNKLETKEDLDYFCTNVSLYLADEAKKEEDKTRKAPDKDKLLSWSSKFKEVCELIPVMHTEEGKIIEHGIRESVEIVKNYIKQMYPTLK